MQTCFFFNGESFRDWRQYKDAPISEIAAMINILKEIAEKRKIKPGRS